MDSLIGVTTEYLLNKRIDKLEASFERARANLQDCREAYSILEARFIQSRTYADKLAAGLPDGILPKDVEVLRKANGDFAQRNFELEAENERLTKREAKNEMWHREWNLLADIVDQLRMENERFRQMLEYIRCESKDPIAVMSADAVLKESE